MQRRMWENAYRATLVCIDSYEDSTLHGRLYNSFLPEGTIFRSTMEFLLLMEKLLDDMNFPQPYMAKREFSPMEITTGGLPGTPPDGNTATFSVRVLFRQNATWQGGVTWLETGQEESFRSALELLLMMHSALGTKAKK